MIELVSLAVPIGLGLLSFFAYKVLGIAKQVNDLKEWKIPNMCKALDEHIRVERLAIEKVQARVEAIFERQSELVAHRTQLEQIHSKLGTVAMNVQSLEGFVRHKCGEPFSHDN